MALGPLAAAEEPHQAAPDSMPQPVNSRFQDLKWGLIFPDAGALSAEICILHSDPATGAARLMIRMPRNFHVPKHWHSANETHTVISGTFIMQCEGKRVVLGPGGFNYMPRKMVHEAWTSTKEGATVFITVDSPWDINWVNGPPKPSDLVGGVKLAAGR